jgi:hypothetical protein
MQQRIKLTYCWQPSKQCRIELKAMKGKFKIYQLIHGPTNILLLWFSKEYGKQGTREEFEDSCKYS